jgi:hypothetical protein
LQADASATTRRKPLPGFWHATITPSPTAPPPASAVVLTNPMAASAAMTIARPYTCPPFVDERPS